MGEEPDASTSWPLEVLSSLREERERRSLEEKRAAVAEEELRAASACVEALTEEASLLRQRAKELEQEVFIMRSASARKATHVSVSRGGMDVSPCTTARGCDQAVTLSPTKSSSSTPQPSSLVAALAQQLQAALIESAFHKQRANELQTRLDRLEAERQQS